jgi:hypothetical protein
MKSTIKIDVKEKMTVLELSNLAVLLEKYSNSLPDFSNKIVELFGEIYQIAIAKLVEEQGISFGEASRKFYDMCLAQKLHEGKVKDG